MSKWRNGWNDFVNNCELSALESITLPTTSATAITMNYDGYILSLNQDGNGGYFKCYVNEQLYQSGGRGQGWTTTTIPVNKGDVVYAPSQDGYGSGGLFAQFYKKRDYSNR